LLTAAAQLTQAQSQFRMPGAGVTPALPQPTVLQPQNSPLLSPWLNLVGRGGNPAVNYYLGVVPERARRANEAQLGSTVNQLIPDIGRLIEEPLVAPEQGEQPIVPTGVGIRPLPSQGFGTTAPAQFGPGSDVPRPRFGNGIPDARIMIAPANLPPRRIPQ
jgi:hypothetical protein